MINVRFSGNYEQYFNKLPQHVRNTLNNDAELVARETRKNTHPFVPKKTGKLRERGFRRVKTYATNKVIVEVEYEAVSERGFVYSYIQEHKQYKNYTTPGTHSRYLRKGLSKSIHTTKRIYVNSMNKAIRSA